ncbi:MAG TPA: hypothetical protein VGH33_06140 [Isosphaeraceae bacterium]|jgi:hypothetical protein
MSLDPRSEPVAQGSLFPAPGGIVFACLALFLRLAVGLGLLNFGLAAIMAAVAAPFGGWTGMRPPSSQGFIPGIEVLFSALPYACAAIGVGLVFGIFTTISALLACAVTLLLPLILTIHLLIAGGLAFSPGFNPIMRGLGSEAGVITIVLCVFVAPTLVALVLLSSPGVNRFSIDAYIFARTTRPVFGGPVEPPPAPEGGSP